MGNFGRTIVLALLAGAAIIPVAASRAEIIDRRDYDMGQADYAPLIVGKEIKPGEIITYDGPVIFKVRVPDRVQVYAEGVLLEKGGGSGLALFARERLAAGRNLDVGSVDGSKRIRPSHQQFPNAVAGIYGVLCNGPLGHNVTIKSDNSVHVQDAGDHLLVETKERFSARTIGRSATVDAGGSSTIDSVGKEAFLRSGGRLEIGASGAGTTIDAPRTWVYGELGPQNYIYGEINQDKVRAGTTVEERAAFWNTFRPE